MKAVINKAVSSLLNLENLISFNLKYTLYTQIFVFVFLMIIVQNIFFISLYYSCCLLCFYYFSKKENKVKYLNVINIYLLISLICIYSGISDIVHYSDQYSYITGAYSIYNEDLSKIIMNDTNSTYVIVKKLWTKIMSFLLYLSNGYLEIILLFNTILYLISSILFVETFKKIVQNNYFLPLFAIMLLSPPIFFVNSLYLKSPFIMSMLILFAVSIIRKEYFLLIISAFLIYEFRSIYLIAFIFLLIVYLFITSKEIKLKFFFLASFLFILFILFYVFNDSKFVKYVNLVLNKDMHDHYARLILNGVQDNKIAKYYLYNQEDFFSIRNILLTPLMGLLDTPPVRFIKHFSIKILYENLFISIYWFLTLPFVFLSILSVRKINIILFLLFSAVFLSSSMSLMSHSLDVFRYRLPIYGIMSISFFNGIYIYQKYYKNWYNYILYSWYIMAILAYCIYLFI